MIVYAASTTRGHYLFDGLTAEAGCWPLTPLEKRRPPAEHGPERAPGLHR